MADRRFRWLNATFAAAERQPVIRSLVGMLPAISTMSAFKEKVFSLKNLTSVMDKFTADEHTAHIDAFIDLLRKDEYDVYKTGFNLLRKCPHQDVMSHFETILSVVCANMTSYSYIAKVEVGYRRHMSQTLNHGATFVCVRLKKCTAEARALYLPLFVDLLRDQNEDARRMAERVLKLRKDLDKDDYYGRMREARHGGVCTIAERAPLLGMIASMLRDETFPPLPRPSEWMPAALRVLEECSVQELTPHITAIRHCEPGIVHRPELVQSFSAFKAALRRKGLDL